VDRGDEKAALEAAYRSFGQDLWRAILAYSGGRGDVADEAVAEAFAQAAGRLRSIRDLRPWLYRAAFKIAAGELKRRSRSPGPLPEDGMQAVPGGDEEMIELMELVRTLTPAQRGSFVLRELLGFTTAETAELLGRSEVSVRVHLHAARKRLGVELEETAR